MSPSHQTEPAASKHGARTPSPRNISPRTLIAAALGGLLVLFALLNSQTVTIHWIVTSTQTPLIVVIAGCGLIGFAVGWLLHWRRSTHRNPG